MKLDVYAEIQGSRELVGTIETLPGSGEEFRYTHSWLNRRPAFPLSLSLPLTDMPYPARAMRAYFDGLLPEGNARAAIARRLHVNSRAYVKLLAGLGDECIGAVSFYEPENSPSESYQPISAQAIAAFAIKAYESTAALSASNRFSLAGSQAKLSLYRSTAGEWYEARGGAPSTHILKPVSVRFEDSCINEAVCMIAARRLGLNVPEVSVFPGDAPLLCVERYDRMLSGTARKRCGLLVPLRLHQEDMAQALGIVPEHKYEDEPRSYVVRMADVIRDYSVQPLEDMSAFWDYCVFTYLIGNCDSHLKNFGMVRSADWREVKLAPLYDVLNTTLYEGLSRDMGFYFGGARAIDDVNRVVFEKSARDLTVPVRYALKVLDGMSSRIDPVVREVALELEDCGVEGAAEFGDRLIRDMQPRLDAVR